MNLPCIQKPLFLFALIKIKETIVIKFWQFYSTCLTNKIKTQLSFIKYLARLSVFAKISN